MKKSSKIVLAAVMTLASSFALAEKNLKIGVEGAYPPFSEVNSSGEVVGFDIDIANALCDTMQAKCELVQIDWDGLIPALKGRKIDAIIASMSATEERKQSIDFTDRYYRIPVKLIRQKGSDVEFSPESMTGKTIGVQVSTTFDKHMTDLFGEVADIKRYNSNDEAYIDLQAGRLDVVAAESLALKAGFLDTEAGQNYEFFGPDLTDEKYYGEGIAIGIRQGQDELKADFNNAIKTIRENGTYKAINDKYFEIDVYGE